ncbi:MAG: TolC family protein [Acidobacteriota bacterium]|nr:TolC family protein [Acidobacteriota bacterium]MDE3264278.1 TolC family protein [Acidobacteriota bacterium]
MVRHTPCLLAAVLLTVGWAGTSMAETGQAAPVRAPADRVTQGIADEALRALVEEVLERNPGLRAGFARARAAAQKAPQAASLPDPMAEATAFLAPPETRVGPQRLMLGYSQPLPWLPKLDLREEAAVHGADALEYSVQADRLRLVTEARRLYYELAFLDRSRETAETFLEHLIQHEEVAQARYATGVGSTQAVLKLQAEITRAERALVDLDLAEAALRARLNSLRDRPATAAVVRGSLPAAVEEAALEVGSLGALARSSRPELRAAEAGLARAETLEDLARMASRPDFNVGVTYTLVTPRDDEAGRLLAPAGNGNDVFGVRGGVTLPLRRRSRAAAVQEALDLRSQAVDERRAAELVVESEVGDLTQRLPLAWRRLRLLEDLLVVQAEEALESAEAGYIAGSLNTLDLFDAEHVLFEAQTATDRARADYLIGLAELEGAIGRPLAATKRGGTKR